MDYSQVMDFRTAMESVGTEPPPKDPKYSHDLFLLHLHLARYGPKERSYLPVSKLGRYFCYVDGKVAAGLTGVSFNWAGTGLRVCSCSSRAAALTCSFTLVRDTPMLPPCALLFSYSLLDDVATRRADLHEDYKRAAQGLPLRAVVRRKYLPAAAAVTLGAIRDTWRAFGRSSQAQLWLVQAPPGFQQCVWDVVVMAALAATEHGRVQLRGMTRAAAALGIQTVAAAAPEAAVAVADFWSRLMQFAQLGVPQKGWDGVDATHPILAVVNGEMLCALPQATMIIAVPTGELDYDQRAGILESGVLGKRCLERPGGHRRGVVGVVGVHLNACLPRRLDSAVTLNT
eukprot:XP_001693601.1 predicted protein [Chlamydomonas reinhardtii]